MTTTVTVSEAAFSDAPGMAHAHTDERRTITEDVVYKDDTNEIHVRITRIQVTGIDVQLGNHFHSFDEKFVGIGGGMLYVAPCDNLSDITSYNLPRDGWETTIPAGVVHTFVLSAPAVLISHTDQFFVSPDNQDEYPGTCINTQPQALDLSRISA